MKYKPFYIWWIYVLLISTAIFWIGHEGFILDIWQKDVTYFSSLLSLIFLYSVGTLGYVSWEISQGRVTDKIKKLLKRVWFLSEIEMGVAIAGTSIGLILLFNLNADVNVADAAGLQAMITELWSTLGAAFYPNAAGLVGSLVLKVMTYFIVEDLTDEKD